MLKNLEQTMEAKVAEAKASVELKLFKRWKLAKDDDEAAKIRAEMGALSIVVTELIKDIRKGIQ